MRGCVAPCILIRMTPAETGQSGFSPGTVLGGRFRIVRAVGRGGMGIVYEAIDEKLDRRVALKCARRGYRDRLPPEARAAREVSHFNICKVHEFHSLATPAGEIDCLSMEFIEGETLAARVHRGGPLAGAAAREIARQICAGLAQAHRQGVIHGDLKCGNVILAKSREGGVRAVVTDFGLARLKDAGDDAGRGGTQDYMAPEQLLGESATAASDIYALGVLFHAMLTGRTPARAAPLPAGAAMPKASPETRDSTATLVDLIVEQDWHRKIEPLPARWKKIVSRCLSARPEARYRSADLVAAALEPSKRLLRWTAAAAGLVVLAGAGMEFRNSPPLVPVRLAVLPIAVEGGRLESAEGIGIEVADRLSGTRRKFTVISPREAERSRAGTLANARGTLGATHALETRVRLSGAQLTADATLADLSSGRAIRSLHGSYAAGDSAALAKALVATVTEAFRLPRGSPKESVSPAAYPYYVQGIDLLRQDVGNPGKVLPLLARAVELDPRSALPFAGLAEALVQQYKTSGGTEWLDKAAATVAKARSINADSVPVLLASGLVHQQHGRYEQAIREFTRATELVPDNSEAWRRLAQCYEETNRTDEAIATFQKAIEAQPNYYRHYLTFGTFYFNRSQFERAEEQYRRAVAAAPDLAAGHMNLGLALMENGRFREAEAELLAALRLRGSSRLLMNIGGLYYAQERFGEAALFFEKSLRAGEGSAVLYRDLGDAYRQLGKLRQASEAYRRGTAMVEEDIQRNPRRAASHATLALLAAFLRDSRRAEFEASQALAMEPENRAVIRDAVIAYEFLGRRQKALAVLQNAPRRLLEEMDRQPDVKNLRKDPQFQDILHRSWQTTM